MTVTSKNIRGAQIGFTSTFTNENGASFTPDSASLKVVYNAAGVETTSTVAMALASNIGTASWDSSVADAGYVYWFINTAGSSKAADQGDFILVANPANPSP